MRLSGGAVPASALSTVTIDYTYNARNQLITETANDSYAAKAYSYDNNGNLTRILETVDAEGAAIEVAESTMTYDRLNRLLSHRGQNGWEQSTYRGGKWHRASQSSDGVSRAFLYDGDNVVEDISGGNIAALYVTPALDQNLSLTTGGNTYYYSHDGLGSVRTVTDASGNMVNTYDYTPFGGIYANNTSENITNRYQYTGREQNPVSDTMYYRYRTYATTAGRFVSRDPSGYPNNIDGNLYVYCYNRATSWYDPYGLRGGTGYDNWDCPYITDCDIVRDNCEAESLSAFGKCVVPDATDFTITTTAGVTTIALGMSKKVVSKAAAGVAGIVLLAGEVGIALLDVRTCSRYYDMDIDSCKDEWSACMSRARDRNDGSAASKYDD